MASIVERIDLDGASNVMRVLIRLTAPFSRLSGHIELETRHGMGGFWPRLYTYTPSDFPTETFRSNLEVNLQPSTYC